MIVDLKVPPLLISDAMVMWWTSILFFCVWLSYSNLGWNTNHPPSWCKNISCPMILFFTCPTFGLTAYLFQETGLLAWVFYTFSITLLPYMLSIYHPVYHSIYCFYIFTHAFIINTELTIHALGGLNMHLLSVDWNCLIFFSLKIQGD
jgi:hypothetical protein